MLQRPGAVPVRRAIGTGRAACGTRAQRPPHDTYDAHLGARQRLYDPSLAPRRAVERAQLAESRGAGAGRRSSRSDRRSTTPSSRRCCCRRSARSSRRGSRPRGAAPPRRGSAWPRRRAAERRGDPRGGAAPPPAVARRARGDREAALEVLGAGRSGDRGGDRARVAGGCECERRLGTARHGVRPDAAGHRATRPEYEQFAARPRLARRADAPPPRAQDRPRVSAFGRAGYGRPGLNPLARDFDTYWLAGVQLQWTPWNWGRPRARSRGARAPARRSSPREEAAFAASLDAPRSPRRSPRSTRLEQSLAQDDADHRAARAGAARDAAPLHRRSRHLRGVRGPADRPARGAPRARAPTACELAQARARFLTTLGRGGPLMRHHPASPSRRSPLGISLAGAIACRGDGEPDAYGNFEATEVVVSAQTSGPARAASLPVEGVRLERRRDRRGRRHHAARARARADRRAARRRRSARARRSTTQIRALEVAARRSRERTLRAHAAPVRPAGGDGAAARPGRARLSACSSRRSRRRGAQRAGVGLRCCHRPSARVAQIRDRIAQERVAQPDGGHGAHDVRAHGRDRAARPAALRDRQPRHARRCART